MRRLTTILACVSTAAIVSACDPHYDNGYYDANGNYVASKNVNNGTQRNRNNETWPGKPAGYYNDSNNYNNDQSYRAPHHGRRMVTDTDTMYLYQLPGVYNTSGDYLGSANSYGVPSSLVPSRGMCLVWFPNRMTYDQPQAQSCDGLIDRAPNDSYIVYGG